MRRVFPYPFLWLGLFAMWLLLNQSIATGHLILGALVATFGGWAAAAVEAPRSAIRRPLLIAKLVWLVTIDILRSNIAVLGLILSGRKPKSVFVTIPLELRDPNALAVLACIITATPGSAWVDYTARTDSVIVHVLDTDDATAWVDTIKRTYETLLVEIFR